MNILDKIVKDKLLEVENSKQKLSIKQLEAMPLFQRDTISLSKRLRQSSSGIIAEHKRMSPSKSVINKSLKVEEVAIDYENAGVSGMSVLTDKKYFGGSLEDLVIARKNCNLPLLRKEFIIDEYQILEAKANGADVILLIVAILTKEQVKTFSELAKSIGLEVLLEVHNEVELQESIMYSIDIMGVNNRNLKTFEVSTQISKKLSNQIPHEFVKISESGISSIDEIKDLQNYGFQGFLIGENFMKTDNPGKSASEFIKAIEL